MQWILLCWPQTLDWWPGPDQTSKCAQSLIYEDAKEILEIQNTQKSQHKNINITKKSAFLKKPKGSVGFCYSVPSRGERSISLYDPCTLPRCLHTQVHGKKPRLCSLDNEPTRHVCPHIQAFSPLIMIKTISDAKTITLLTPSLHCHNFENNHLIKNPAYGRQRISRPMRIVGPIQFWKGCVIYLKQKK